MANERKRLRKQQAEAVMPVIGPLLDAYEQLPNDVRDMDELQELFGYLDEIETGMESAE